MRISRSILAGLVLLLSSTSPAAATPTTGGPWFRTDCTTLTSPVSGQVLCFDTTNNVLKAYNGTSWVQITTTGSGTALAVPAGTATLVYTNGTTLTLNPGVIPLKVAGVWTTRAIPSAITLSNATLTDEGGAVAASTTYYVYASDSVGSTVLSLSTGAHAADSSASGWGVEVKGTANTETLVGMVRTDGSTPGQFQGGLLTLSYFNRRTKSANAAFTADRTTTSATYVELNTEIRVPFLTWGDEAALVGLSGMAWTSGMGGGVAAAVDTGTTATSGTETGITGAASGQYVGIGCSAGAALSEGYHYATLIGFKGTQNVTVSGSTAPASRVIVTVRG